MVSSQVTSIVFESSRWHLGILLYTYHRQEACLGLKAGRPNILNLWLTYWWDIQIILILFLFHNHSTWLNQGKKNLKFSFQIKINQIVGKRTRYIYHGQGNHNAKIVLIVCPKKISQMPQKIWAQFVCPSPKVSDFWKKISLWVSVGGQQKLSIKLWPFQFLEVSNRTIAHH